MLFEYKEKSLKSGIYQIKNLINGKVYIGSAKRFKERSNAHLSSLKKGKHHNKHLQAAFNKDGSDSFIFEVLEVVEGDKMIRTIKEKEYLAKYYENWEECYNFQKNPLSTDRTCWSKTKPGFSQEHKEKISKALKDFYQENPDRREILINQILTTKPQEPRAKKYNVDLLSPTGEKYTKIKNLAKFANKHNLDNTHLAEVLYEKRLQHNGWVLAKNKHLLGVKKVPMSATTKEKISMANKGRQHSEETKQKIRIKKLGDKNPRFGKSMHENTKNALLKSKKNKKTQSHVINAIRASREKTYNIKLKDPMGNIYGPITNLSNFCKIHNLERSLLIKVISKQRNHHKNWQLWNE